MASKETLLAISMSVSFLLGGCFRVTAPLAAANLQPKPNPTVMHTHTSNDKSTEKQKENSENSTEEPFAVTASATEGLNKASHSFCSSGNGGVDCTVPVGKVLHISKVSSLNAAGSNCRMGQFSETYELAVAEFTYPFDFASGTLIRFETTGTCEFTGEVIGQKLFQGKSGEFFGAGKRSQDTHECPNARISVLRKHLVKRLSSDASLFGKPSHTVNFSNAAKGTQYSFRHVTRRFLNTHF